MASLASSSLHCFDETCWRIHPAPRPSEVVWSSLGLRVWEVSLRRLGVWALFVLLVLFYLPIVAAIQAPVNMENLQKVSHLMVWSVFDRICVHREKMIPCLLVAEKKVLVAEQKVLRGYHPNGMLQQAC
jgi:hypothetical protein